MVERRVDLAVAGGLVNPHAALAGRLAGVPVVWKIVDTRAPVPLRRVLMPAVARLSDGVMFTGSELIDAHTGGRALRVPAHVYYPPVDTERFRPSPERRAATRRALGVPSGAPVAGMVANLSPQKGVEHFVRAAALVHRAHPETYFVLVGARFATHEQYARMLDSEIRRAGLSPDRFILAGYRTDVEACYPAFDVKLVSSVPRSEGATTAVLEAMACGLPVVSTDVGAIGEVVENERTGLLVPPLDPGALAGATLRLLRDPALRRRLGDEGRRRCAERFGVESCAATHARAFDSAIGRHAGDVSASPAAATGDAR